MSICCALGECVEDFVVEVAQADRVPVVFLSLNRPSSGFGVPALYFLKGCHRPVVHKPRY